MRIDGIICFARKLLSSTREYGDRKMGCKVVIVSGGAGTIGSAFCDAIAAQGKLVVIADSDYKKAKTLASKISSQTDRQAIAFPLDINDVESVLYLINEVTKTHGRIDAVVNNAYPRNSHYGRKLEDVSYEDFNENVNLHLGGYFLIMQKFCEFFKNQGFGHVVNMSSIYGVIPPRFEVYDNTSMTMPVEYAAIKSALIHLTRYFAQYFKGTGVRVNCISPGGIWAEQPADFLAAYNARCNFKGMLNPKDVASVLVFLLNEESRYITGQNIVVDDGYTL